MSDSAAANALRKPVVDCNSRMEVSQLSRATLSRNTYETSWAALDLDSSGWSLGDSSLVMMGIGGNSTASTTNTTTVTTTGSGTGTTSNTSTGVSSSVSSGASYFTRLFTETGATQDGPNKPPSSGTQIPVPGTPTDPQTNPPANPQSNPSTPAPPTVPVAVGQNDAGDDAPGYEPPATRSTPLNLWTGLLPTGGEDPGTILVMPPMASPQGPWDISVTPPGDLNLYNPFVSLVSFR